MRRLIRLQTRLVVLLVLSCLVTACGAKATPAPNALAEAVEATLTALPQPTQQITEVALPSQEGPTPVPTDVPRPTESAETPTVRAVLFYSPECPHCYTVIEQTFVPMMKQYGEQLEVIGIDISQPGGRVLYDASTEQFNVPAEIQGVPRMVVGDRFLVGSLQIPEEFPGIVEEGLASGGIDWPAIPGLAQALAAQQQAEPAKAVEQTPALATASESTPRMGVNNLIPSRRAYSHSYMVTEEYDRFEGVTKVELAVDGNDVHSKPAGSLVVQYQYPGTTPTLPTTVLFSFASVNKEWRFRNCHDLQLLLDGKRMPLETIHAGQVYLSVRVLEQVSSRITLRDFLEIVNAEKVEGRLCTTEFELTPAQMEALRDLASRMQP